MFKNLKNRCVNIVGMLTITGAVVLGGIAPAMAADGDVANPLQSKSYNYSSQYGARCIPTRLASATHPGQDLSATSGTAIKAIANGTVSYIQNASGSSVSGKIVIKHKIDGKTYYSAYYHMWTPTKYVKVGQTVKKGQRIADVGSSGPSTGPHLHLEIWQNAYKTGTLINPTTFMSGQGVDLKADAKAVTFRTQPTECTYYNTSTTALKQSASSSSATIANVSKGTKFTGKNVLGVQSGNYLQVTVNGKTGWMSRTYITPSYVAPSNTSTSSNKATASTTTKIAVKKYSTTSSVNFRSGASTSSPIIQSLPKGSVVTTTGKASGSYYQVTYGSKTGWVHKNYLTTYVAPKAATTVKYKVTSQVNFRSGPSTKYSVISKLKKNTVVVSTGKTSGSYYQVKSGTKTGWIHKSYLKKI